MRKLLAILLMFLLPLQALQAAGVVLCGPVAAAAAAPHAHAESPAHAHHHQGHAVTVSDPAPDPVQAGADRAPAADLHPCCHAVASLPVQHSGLSLPVPAHAAPVLGTLPALSHETSGPFRPPRRLPA